MNLENTNKIIISRHAIQRRKHQNPIDKDILVNLVKQIDDKFGISKKENNKYKIGTKNIVLGRKEFGRRAHSHLAT